MTAKIVSDEEFIKLWRQASGSPRQISELSGMSERVIYKRRQGLANKGIILQTSPRGNPGSFGSWSSNDIGRAYKNQNELHVDTGSIIIFSDAHWWPNQWRTVAHEALHILIKELKPRAVVANGDIFDGAQCSRHGSIGFLEQKPSIIQELHACQEMMGQIVAAAPKSCFLTWPLGNHDARFETYLAANAPQYEFVQGFHLKDHFPEWKPCWATWINGHTVIKHRWKGGIHATHNNTVQSGVSIVTGHLHSLKVTPWTDYNGTRYGVDTGTLSDPNGQQFLHYTEDNPKNWRSGFAVLTFWKGELLPPELVTVIDDDTVSFRGKAIQV